MSHQGLHELDSEALNTLKALPPKLGMLAESIVEHLNDSGEDFSTLAGDIIRGCGLIATGNSAARDVVVDHLMNQRDGGQISQLDAAILIASARQIYAGIDQL